MRTSISTSDSDVSPHTSTVVENGILQNGWTNSDITLKIPPGNKRGSSGIIYIHSAKIIIRIYVYVACQL